MTTRALAETQVIYGRASSDPKETFSSVTVQVDNGKQVGKLNGWRTARVFTDNNMSAATGAKARPAFAEMCEYVREHRVDYITVFSSSRLTRDAFTFNDVVELCVDTETKLCISGSILDPADAQHLFQGRILNAVDSFFIDQLRKNVKAAMSKNAEDGKPHGIRTFGYRRLYDDRTGRCIGQIPDEVEAPLFQQAVAGLLDGTMTVTQAGKLIGRANPTVRRMMMNPVYLGHRTHNGVISKRNAWDALVTEKQHVALKRLFDGRSTGPRLSPARVYPYTGILLCGVCGSKLTAQQPSKNDPHGRYVCAKCRKVAIRMGYLDTEIEARLQEALDELHTGDPTVAEEPAEVVALRAKRDRLYAKRDELKLAYDNDEFETFAEYREMRDRNTATLTEVEDALDALEPAVLSVDAMPRDLAGLDADEETTTKAFVAKTLLNSITVRPVGRGRRTWEWDDILDFDWR